MTAPRSAATERFWALIEASGPSENPYARYEVLRGRLAALPPQALIEFQRELELRMGESYSVELWGAAYLFLGGCSEDGFEYFRGLLILCGRGVFEAALRDPDSLVTLDVEIPEMAEMLSVAREVYEESTGQDMPALDASPYPEIDFDGVDFEDDEYMRSSYPRLFAKHIGR